MALSDRSSLITGSFDIGSAHDQERIRLLADLLIESEPTVDALVERARLPDTPIDLALALKLARSKAELGVLRWSGRLAVVFAMWGEQRRLVPRTVDNPTGEDAMRTKLDQLDWLLGDTGVDWSVVAVDDGDPNDSATPARRQAEAHPCGDRVAVLRLTDALPSTAGPLVGLASADDSRKGGSIALGAQHALGAGVDAVIVTDADNSVHLGQIGLLIAPHVRGGAGAVVGDRKHPDAVLLKAEARWGPGIVVLRHMQRMVGRSLFATGLRDTQAAFKLFDRRALQVILEAPSTFGFSFDADWLFASLTAGVGLERVPLAFIDSFEESASLAQGPMTTWSSLLTGLVAAARARGADHDEEMAAVIDDYARAEILQQVVQTVPEPLRDVADVDLGQRSTMTPEALREWLADLTAPTT